MNNQNNISEMKPIKNTNINNHPESNINTSNIDKKDKLNENNIIKNNGLNIIQGNTNKDNLNNKEIKDNFQNNSIIYRNEDNNIYRINYNNNESKNENEVSNINKNNFVLKDNNNDDEIIRIKIYELFGVRISNGCNEEKSEILINNDRLEIVFKLNERETISQILELSNERIAINNIKELKIYSLNTFKLITKIDNNKQSVKYIELGSKDLARISVTKIQFFQLSGKEYQLFQTIDEKEVISSFIKLKRGSLLLTCNYKSTNIYEKEKNKYKLISKNNSEKDCEDAIEIEDNKVVIFKNKSETKYHIFLYDIQKKIKTILMKDYYVSGKYSREYLNMIKNDKYLFVNFGVKNLTSYNRNMMMPFGNYPLEPPTIQKVGYVFNLEKENYMKLQYDRFPDKSGEIKAGYPRSNESKIDFSLEIVSNYNNNILIARYLDNLKLCEFKNKTFILKKFPLNIKYDDDFKIIKLKNNKFIIYKDNEMLLIKSN
jgi:hypothetical protein